MKSRDILPFTLTGVLITSLSVVANEPPITDLAFTPEAKHVVAVSQSGIHLYAWPELDHRRTIRTSTSNLHSVAFSPNEKYLAVGGGAPSEDGVVEVFSWPKGEPITRFDSHNDSVRSVIWQNNDRLLTASIDREIKLWHLEKETNSILTLKGHSRSVDAICLIGNGQTLVSTGADQSLRVWDMESGTLIRSMNQHTKPVNALELRPVRDGLPMVASAARDRTIRFWQPTIGRMVRYIRLDSEPLNIAWTNDGDRVLATCVDGRVRIIDPVEVTVTQDLPAINGWAYAIAMHPHDRSAAIGGINGQIWRIENFSEPGARSEPR